MTDILFNTIASGIRTNTHHAEADNSRAVSGAVVNPKKVLVVGRKLAAGTVAELVVKPVLSASQADGYHGLGSEIAEMVRAYKAVDSTTEMYTCAIDELTGGTAGTKTLTVSGTATAPGTLHCYIDGDHYIPVAVASGDAATAVAAALDAAITAHNNYGRMPYTSGVASAVVTATMRWKGVAMGDIRFNYNDSDEFPAGISVVVATATPGAGNPDMAEVITAIGSNARYNSIVMPFNDATNLGLLETELATRWGGMDQRMGHGFACTTDTHANTTTQGNSRNSPHLTIMGGNESPTASWKWAAITAAVDTFEPAPARPRHTLALSGAKPAADALIWNQAEKNIHLYDGISTHSVDPAGNITVDRLITTYQTNAQGTIDPSYLDITTIRTIEALRDDLISSVSRTYSRHMYDAEGEADVGSLPVVTNAGLRGFILARYKEVWSTSGWVKASAYDQFEAELVVIQDPADSNRAKVQMGPALMNQFRGMSAQLQYML